jgi:5-methylcytosine-specific restriction endonuclease McrA
VRDMEKKRASCRAWHHANREVVNESNRARYALDPSKKRATVARWRKRNPDKVNAQHRALYKVSETARTTQKVNAHNRRRAPGKITKNEVRAIMKDPCAYCGSPPEHLEHCTPLCRGGWNVADNCVAACARCNLGKGWKTVLEWMGMWP